MTGKTAIEDLRRLRKISNVGTEFTLALIVRRLKIGYARAGNLIEHAIEENVVFEGSKLGRYEFNENEMDAEYHNEKS